MEHDPTLLLVEDDPRIAASLRAGLEEEGFRVAVAPSCREADRILGEGSVSAIILDLGLPDRDGIEWLQELRQNGGSLPVLILTARDAIEQRVLGLEAGGDDYLAKPFAFSELVARIKAITRRTAAVANLIAVGDLTIDLVNRGARRSGLSLDLSPREFDVLAHLAHKAGTTVSRDTLMRDVWKINQRATSMDNVIDVLMVRLREKVDKPFSAPLIHTIRGVGYRLLARP
ncbi:MAG TPA: response regulator transcription factor [Kiritimatiellia bacterium]|nr:response regulator transcription factor [Kiritimatiellia bacterium]